MTDRASAHLALHPPEPADAAVPAAKPKPRPKPAAPPPPVGSAVIDPRTQKAPKFRIDEPSEGGLW